MKTEEQRIWGIHTQDDISQIDRIQVIFKDDFFIHRFFKLDRQVLFLDFSFQTFSQGRFISPGKDIIFD